MYLKFISNGKDFIDYEAFEACLTEVKKDPWTLIYRRCVKILYS
ncbi:hypothetical protein NO2_0145 [Candidatus Termititenax persephonae]|uniref:Uncharacterized protein n=1 Tax=Candidatus Termititenax persephonae TaxID=2218525 RepID=A0A388TFF3_9BACT|nr:hypothetical protein NO2_0145 [Candidatus Termititenax persephonae]